ncbi:acetate--CoA ligase [Starmerella bacillaris]|uniref:Acetyl-coenzyme A synthetase n=1 Tax=Starmerella bacillaris TaxID=1247836 RepID=A0AAV5RPM2_STABA|nr:acetate--CoA ligase [Starmerella bacillaris]
MTLEAEKLMNVPTIPAPATALPPASSEVHVRNMDQYKALYEQSINDPETFFGEQSKALSWDRDFDKVLYHVGNNFSDSPAWFVGGKLNASYNCVDRWALQTPNKVAIIYEGDDAEKGYSITYSELLVRVCQMAQLLQSKGVKVGDVVTIYLPMTPEAVISMLAVARIGAIHSCIFAGFSPGAIKDRVIDSNSHVVITCDKGYRATKVIQTKKIVDEALESCPDVKTVVVINRDPSSPFPQNPERDVIYPDAAASFKSYCAPVPVDSEHPLFLLYTSGSTGKPKGMQHCTAGYLLGALLTTRHIFGVTPDDTLFTSGDIGWITGHTYAVYGPLANGATTVIFESTPVYPTPTRYWDIVDRHKVTQFYTAPTALRLLRQYGHEIIDKYDLSSLRALGSVGEPIAEEIWEWYFNYVGRGRCTVCDTYWLTESGSHLVSSIPGVTPMKPGSAGLPFFGIKPAIVDPVSGHEITERPAEGVFAISQPWPSMARSIFNDYARYQDTYLKPYPGFFFTGDGASIDSEGYIFIGGRMDDVVNVSGHRLSTAEVESSVLDATMDGESMMTECAVVGVDDEITGQALVVFAVCEPWLKDDIASGKKIPQDISIETILIVRKEIGPFAAPRKVYLVDDLPKTRSGKILRRVLRKIVAGEEKQLGELSTLSDPSVVPALIDAVKNQK